jgi:hypothetical protein
MNTALETTTLDPGTFTERFINQTNRSIFLTGKAGTGKTTLLRKIVSSTHKNTVIVAPTGIAALNAGGVTIHSFFQLPFGSFIPDFQTPSIGVAINVENKSTLNRHFRMNQKRISLIRNLELLIVDEVSMLRADLLDAMDWTLRSIRRNNFPFGGVQLLFIGDLHQLPPVVKNDEWEMLKLYYKGIHFFNSLAVQEEQPLYIELEKIYRQDDPIFISLLNNLRNNLITQHDLDLINQNIRTDLTNDERKGYITLTTHNYKADEMNTRELASLDKKSHFYEAEIEGEFPPHLFPIEPRMELKVGAQIMFIKNDISLDKQFYNGKMGFIESLRPEEITVSFPEEKKNITVEKYEWTNIKYSLDENSQEIKEEVLGTFVHYPIKLAWAITVHKSQGLTFEKAILDVSDAFAPGQAYVAFSRLTSLKGLVLLKPLQIKGIANDQQMMDYAKTKADKEKLHQSLSLDTLNYLKTQILLSFDWYQLFTLWSVHTSSYNMAAPKSEKAKHTDWAKKSLAELDKTNEPATKFRRQIESLFTASTPDLNHIQQRIEAAYSYFYGILDPVLTDTYRKLMELQLFKKTKQIIDEIELLSEGLLKVILDIKKLKLFFEAIVNGREITKTLYKTSEIENYKLAKIALVQNEFRQKASKTLIPTSDEIEFKVTKNQKKLNLETKKSTYDLTLELLYQGNTIEEIARSRQLSQGTINSHFVQLLKAEKIELADIMEQHRISELQELLENKELGSLSKVMDELRDQISWDELKLYQASKML